MGFMVVKEPSLEFLGKDSSVGDGARRWAYKSRRNLKCESEEYLQEVRIG
jgi:hypothetical protein